VLLSQDDLENRALRVTKRTQWGSLIDCSTTYTLLLFVYVCFDLYYSHPRGWQFNSTICNSIYCVIIKRMCI